MTKVGIVNCTYFDQALCISFVNSVRSKYYKFQFYIHDNTNENWGYAKGMNDGIKKAYEDGCEYIFVGNADSELAPDFLDILIPLLKKNPEYMLLSGTRDDEVCYTTDFEPLSKMQMTYPSRIVKFDPDMSAFVMPRKAIEVIKEPNGIFFNEKIWPLYFEDDFVKMRLYQAGYKFGKVNTAIERHAISTTMHSGHGEAVQANWQKNMDLFINEFGIQIKDAPWRAFTKDHIDFKF